MLRYSIPAVAQILIVQNDLKYLISLPIPKRESACTPKVLLFLLNLTIHVYFLTDNFIFT